MISCLSKTLIVFVGVFFAFQESSYSKVTQVFAQTKKSAPPTLLPTPKLELAQGGFFDSFPRGVTTAWEQIDPTLQFRAIGVRAFVHPNQLSFLFGNVSGALSFCAIVAKHGGKDAEGLKLVLIKQTDLHMDRWRAYWVTHNLDLSCTWLSASNWGLVAIEERKKGGQRLCVLTWDEPKQTFSCVAQPWHGKRLEPAPRQP
jgi:hypothetical protein